MCGIAGIMNLDKTKINPIILHRMDELLSHRGPDGHGEVIYRNVGLANRRLAIIDPTSFGHQPMTTEDKNLWITFNGEIFNYKELRYDLIEKGYQFRSHTDTETILYGYKHYGENFIKQLIGQFAFCIWDKKKECFFLARDQIGINPLYYAIVDKTFLFASEVKALLASGLIKKELDPEALHHYLSVFHIPAPLTIFKGIKSLLPGHFIIIDKNNLRTKKYYDIPIGHWQKGAVKQEEMKNKLRELLISSVQYAKVADVPVAAFLSGGIDSSTVVALMASQVTKPVKTFSLWAEGGKVFDERRFARLIAKQYKTDHTEFTVTEKELISELPKIIYYFDQPTGGSLETYFISKYAAQQVKVALSGLGGDELFAGYHSNIYQTKLIADIYHFIPPKIRSIFLTLLNNLPLSPDIKKTIQIADRFLNIPSLTKRYLYLYFAYHEEEKKQLFSNGFRQYNNRFNTAQYFEKLYQKVKNFSPVDMFTFVDLQTYTRDDLLLGMNMMSMANSLEARVPLLDPRLVDLSSSIVPDLKYRQGISKFILKEAVREWLPSDIINHKKTGFAIPRTKYMKGVLKPYILSILNRNSVRKRGIFNADYIEKEINKFYSDISKKMLWSQHLRIWILFVFELWCRLYLDQAKITPPNQSLSDLTKS